MSNLPVLFRKYKEALRHYIELEHELADLDRQIHAADRPTAPTAVKRRRKPGPPQQGGANEKMRSMLRVMREAKDPLPPREIASRLNITPNMVSRRLARAIRLGYVERTGTARYSVSSAVPSL